MHDAAQRTYLLSTYTYGTRCCAVADEPEVDAARAPPQLTSLAHADQAASPYEARIMAGDDGSSSGEAASTCTLFPGIYFLPVSGPSDADGTRGRRAARLAPACGHKSADSRGWLHGRTHSRRTRSAHQQRAVGLALGSGETRDGLAVAPGRTAPRREKNTRFLVPMFHTPTMDDRRKCLSVARAEYRHQLYVRHAPPADVQLSSPPHRIPHHHPPGGAKSGSETSSAPEHPFPTRGPRSPRASRPRSPGKSPACGAARRTGMAESPYPFGLLRGRSPTSCVGHGLMSCLPRPRALEGELGSIEDVARGLERH